MCGRYTIHDDINKLEEWFGAEFEDDTYRKRYNAAPGNSLPVILNTEPQLIQMIRWGMEPVWWKQQGRALINVRTESFIEKKTFQKHLRERRCLILANGFYEWKTEGGGKQPYYFKMKSSEPFAFAGIWEMDRIGATDKKRPAFSILTTAPNAIVKQVHNRMPCMLKQGDLKAWLESEEPAKALKVLNSYPVKEMESYPVSRSVNSGIVDVEDLILPDVKLG
ncbi:SOS response-associated peptidase [Candidatus Uhrbacteria bacterium]|nr:SOS response-associated peptidase [Candidatus Uhrbacteria bacterium]MBD3284308.1 SOS response-associated peptidase [Candidatus Uhrbacteria bacterium]